MGELVAWGLGLGLGYSVRTMLIGWKRIAQFAIAIILLGGLITLFSGEMASEPWLVFVDIAEVGAAALIGAYGVPYVRGRRLQVRRPKAP